MARFDLDAWLADASSLGARLCAADLRGGLQGLFAAPRLKVPPGAVASVRFEDGSRRRLREGEEVQGEFEAVLVKIRRFDLALDVSDLLSREDLPFSFTAEAEMAVDGEDAAVADDFAGAFLAGRAAAGHGEVQAALTPEIEEAVRNFTAQREAAELVRGDRTDEIEGLLREALARTLFDTGLSLVALHRARFTSDDYGRILDDKVEATVEEERAKRREIIRDAWIKDQKQEILSSKEVRDLMQALEHEGALKALERRKEKLQAEQELQALARKAAEEKLAAEARTASNLLKVLEEAGFKDVLETFLEIARAEARDKPVSATGVDPRLHAVPAGRTHLVLCAAGREVLAFRPDRDQPAEVHNLAAGPLGMIRSVQTARLDDRDAILAGAQHGVYLLRAGDPPRAYPIPGAGDQRGGVNAAAVHGEALFATHSDFGLLRWPLSDPGAGRPVRTDLTAGRPTCRGVQTGPLDRLLFASGPDVWALLPENLDGTPTRFAGQGDNVTALACTGLAVFAGTAGGDVLRWDWETSDAPARREIARRPDPVFMLKTCAVGGLPVLLVGTKGYAVLAKTLENDAEVSYPAEARIRWVDGASDHVFGVDREGRRLFVWTAGDARVRPREIRSRERIQDLAVWLERAPESA